MNRLKRADPGRVIDVLVVSLIIAVVGGILAAFAGFDPLSHAGLLTMVVVCFIPAVGIILAIVAGLTLWLQRTSAR